MEEAGSPFVAIDGEVRPPGQQTISVFDRGFLYGDSVFETVRTYGGEPFRLKAHLRRLAISAGQVALPLPIAIGDLEREVRWAVRESGFPEAYVRIMVTRGEGPLGLVPRPSTPGRRVLLVLPLPERDPALDRGIRLASYRTMRAADVAGVSGAKVANYLASVLALRHASEQGASEALLLDDRGRVLEGATSNVFWVEGGELWTPPLEAGILEGITRAETLAAAEELAVPVRFESPLLERLMAADEVFITSSIREIVPAVAIDGEPVGAGLVGPVTQALRHCFRQRTRLPEG